MGHWTPTGFETTDYDDDDDDLTMMHLRIMLYLYWTPLPSSSIPSWVEGNLAYHRDSKNNPTATACS